MSQNFLRNEVYPAIYSGYPSLLDGIYSRWRLDTGAERLSYLHSLQGPAIELWKEFQKQDVSPDYSRSGYQDVYLLRYFFPHALPVPYILHDHLEDFLHLEDESLITSFFGYGPGPELYGLMYYLRYFQSGIAMIPTSMLDIAPTGWEYGINIVSENLLIHTWDPDLYEISGFESDLAGESRQLLSDNTEKWLKQSNLIVSQFCLNEISPSKHERLIENIINITDIMKCGALMLIIERQGFVEGLLGKLRDKLEKIKDIRIHYCFDDFISVRYLNYNGHVPAELIEYLFLRKFNSGLWLANDIYIHWLAISKQ